VLYENDFSTSNTGLTSGGSGTWLVQDGMLKQTTCEAIPDGMVSGQSWGDVKVKVDLYAHYLCGSYRQVGLLVRAQSVSGCTSNKYYGCVLDFDDDEVRIGKMHGICDTTNWSKKKTILPVNSGVWYTMVLESKGNSFTCSVQGDLLVLPVTHTWSDPGAPQVAGSAGLLTAGVQTRFDNFTVSSN
jgi:hypothetical protein